MSANPDEVTLKDIYAARERIRSNCVETPLRHFANLSAISQCQLYCKLETLQRCRAFKFRGAYNKLSTLPSGTTVVCASAGNHSQGVSLSATLLGMKAMVYMPMTAPVSKVEATKSYGGTVIQHGLGFDAAYAKCKSDLESHPEWTFIPPFDDNLVIAGQGTIGLEIFEQLPEVDTVVVPVGGGGLASGVAIALKALKPSIRIVCVQSQTRPHTYMKFQKAKGRPIADLGPKFKGNPIADGINVINPGTITFPYIEKLADEFVIVSEDEIVNAIALLAERAKIICEGAGATSVAAVLSHKFSFRPDEKIVSVVSGGNIELQMLSRCIDRALFLWGRRIYFNVSIPLGTDEFIKMLKVLRSFHFEIISTTAFPNADTLANHIRYAVTADIPNPALIDEVKKEFDKNEWIINLTSTHASDE